MIDKYCIIGGGISGLYLAYKLIKIKKIIGCNISIYEKCSNHFGGRILTTTFQNFPISLGAGRLCNKHLNILQLIKELNLMNKIFPMKSNYGLWISNKLYQDAKNLSFKTFDDFIKVDDKYKEETFFTIIDKLQKKSSNNKILFNSTNLFTIISIFYDTNVAQLMQTIFGYQHNFIDINSLEALDEIKFSFEQDIEYYSLKGGLHQITDRLIEILNKHKVNLYLNTEIKTYDKDYLNDTISIKDSIVIFALTKIALQKIVRNSNFPYKIKFLNLLNTNIVNIPLIRIYASFDSYWYKDLPNLVTNTWLGQIIPINEKVIMISYTDSNKAKFLRHLLKNDFISLLEWELKKQFPTYNSQIKEIIIYSWETGVHGYTMNYKEDLNNTITKMYAPYNIYFVGEIFASIHGWIEGALISSNLFLNNFNLKK